MTVKHKIWLIFFGIFALLFILFFITKNEFGDKKSERIQIESQERKTKKQLEASRFLGEDGRTYYRKTPIKLRVGEYQFYPMPENSDYGIWDENPDNPKTKMIKIFEHGTPYESRQWKNKNINIYNGIWIAAKTKDDIQTIQVAYTFEKLKTER